MNDSNTKLGTNALNNNDSVNNTALGKKSFIE